MVDYGFPWERNTDSIKAALASALVVGFIQTWACIARLRSPPTMEAAMLQTSVRCYQNVSDFYISSSPEGVHGVASPYGPKTHSNTSTLNAILHFFHLLLHFRLSLSLRINPSCAVLIP